KRYSPVMSEDLDEPRTIDPGVSVGHVHLKAADLARIEDFYVGLLGFQIKARLPGALFLAAGDYHHHLAFNTWQTKGGQPAPEGTTGLYHIALLYPSRASLAEALRRLVRAGWPLDGTADHGTHLAIYLRDPEGNGLELAWDRPREQWPRDPEGNIRFVTEPAPLMSFFEED
ncbi:MAG TPA: VOC family protein, partial [Fimbriimonadaceae bacterium]|nr:VOC family protein [Fimbriimonadaceae bacterium]